MAIANTVIDNFNVTPYYDDFNENKNFHRVLFKPGLAVQARELTQLQTIFQNQIERFGDHVFKEGTIVQGCEFTLENSIAYVKVRDNDAGGNLVSISTFSDAIITGNTSNVRAKVIRAIDGAESTAPDYNTLLVKYITTGNNNKKVFDDNEILQFRQGDGGESQSCNTIAASATGNGSILYVANGIIYSRGKFVRADEQSIILEKYSTTPSYKVGFRLRETTVDSDEDTTLLDNADGSFNYNAPGADRLKVKAFLDKRTLTETSNSESFSTLVEVENGIVRKLNQDTVYDKLGREFATRTYEESGNYMLNQINVNVKEHLDNGENLGRYSSAGDPAGDINKLAVGVEPGVAFIQGYRNEHTATETISIDKATTTAQETGLNVTTNYGNYVFVRDICGSFDPSTYATVELRDAYHTGYDGGSTSTALSGATAPGNLIGYAKVRFLDYSSGDIGTSSGQYRMYLFDIDVFVTNKSFADTKSIYQNNSGIGNGFANVVVENGFAILKESNFNRLVYKSGLNAVKQLTTSANQKNASFVYRDKQSLTFVSGGTASLSIPTGHAGGTEEFPYGVSTLNNTQKRDFIVVSTKTVYSDAGVGSDTFTTAGSSNTVTQASGSTDLTTKFKTGDFIYLTGATPLVNRITSVSASSLTVAGQPTAVTGVAAKKVFPEGFIFDLTEDGTDAGGRSVVVNSTTQADIDLDETFVDVSGSADTMSAVVYYNNKRENAVPATKLVRKGYYVKIDVGTHRNSIRGPWELGVPDVFKIEAVYLGKNYSATNRNVTDQFELDVNATESVYRHSRLVLKSNAVISLETNDKLLIKFSYFKQNTSAGIGFYSIDSYSIDAQERTTQPTSIATAQIPFFNEYNLRNSIDFRPQHQITATETTLAGSASENPAYSNNVIVDSDGSFVPVADQNFTTDAQYYLPRRDRVVVGKDGKKKVIQGVPAIYPRTPNEPGESLTVATLQITPYPSLSPENGALFERDDLAVKVTPVFQKRYTMNDIQALEDRLNNLEYYSSLNLLEKDAQDFFISNSSGNNRFKNGIFVDSFHGHNNADLDDSSYNISIDSELGELRPRFDIENIDFEYSSGTNIRRKGKQVRLDLNNISGTLAVGDAVYVGPSSPSSTASGTIRAIMSPTSTTRRVYLHDEAGNFTTSTTLVKDAGATPAASANITAVEYPSDGDLITLPYDHVEYAEQPFASKVINPVGQVSFNWIGELELIPESDHWKDTTSLPSVTLKNDLKANLQKLQTQVGTSWNDWRTSRTSTQRNTVIESRNIGWMVSRTRRTVIQTTRDQVRTGIRRTVEPFTTNQTLGNFITNVDIIPFIRSRQVSFAATGMRPNTKVYAFFDEIPVSSYVAPADSSFANTAIVGSQLTTDSNGNVYGNFVIPNNSSLKFRAGEKPFRLADIENVDTELGTETTSAEAMYHATGLAVQTKGIVQSTRNYRLVTRHVRQTRRIVTRRPLRPPFTGAGGGAGAGGGDPVAQTFRIGDFETSLNNFENPFGAGADGAFISCIDLFFQEKSSTAGIAVEIREVVNGYLTDQRVPFGYKRLTSAQVNVSSDSSAVTPFYFDSPVYLRGDKEYAFVVKPDNDNPDFRLWIAKLGGTDIINQALIDKQPAVGIMMVSANDRTYEARQKEDIKYKIWRANFDSSVTGEANFTNEDDEYITITQIENNYNVGEKVIGEQIYLANGFVSNTDMVKVGDKVRFGSNTGKVRQVVANNYNVDVEFKVDMKGTVPNGANLVFTDSAGSTYFGNLVSQTANSTHGFVQMMDPRGFVVLNGSSGNFTSNTTTLNGFYRGQVSNATSQAISLRDFKYNLLNPQMSEISYVDTNCVWSAQTTSNAYSLDATYDNIENLENNEFLGEEKIIASRTNEVTNMSGAKSLKLRARLTSSSSRLSPIIDLKNSKSVIAVRNIINNITANTENREYLDKGGLANARYITKEIVLADGQDAEDLKVYLGAYRPQGTQVHVYAKVRNGEDENPFSEKHYSKMVNVLGSNNFSEINNTDDFVELEYALPTSNASALGAFQFSGNNNVTRYYNANGAYFDTFKSFSIKIVLSSSAGSNLVPRVKDLRAIALQQ